MKQVLKIVLVMAAAFVSVVSAQTGSISGTMVSELNGELVPDVSVEIKELRRTTRTGAEGKYIFESLPPGVYTVSTHGEGFADQIRRVPVSDQPVILDFKLSLKSINAEVTVTATGREESVYEAFSTVNSVGSTRILEKASTSVGEVLENEAGVSVRSFGGGGSGRPSIRGFEGDRVLILQDGVRNGSIGAASGDHGEPIAAVSLERLEVIKGPATLLYGSNAIGGVVNAVSDDENQSHPGLGGYITGLGGTVNRNAGVAAGLEYGWGKKLLNFTGNASREGDIRTPLGKLPNSASYARGGSGSYGFFADKWFVRTRLNVDRRRYGIPFAPLFESGELLSIINGGADCNGGPEGAGVDCQFDFDELKRIFENQLPPESDEEIDIKMRRNNYRGTFGFHDVKGPFESGTFNFDLTDYRHQEIESEGSTEEVATTFDNDVFSYRAILGQRKYKRLSGQIGFEGYRRSYLTEGAEALIDGRVRQNNVSFFGLQEISFEKVALQFGARVERNGYNPANAAIPDLSFTGFSGSLGARFSVWKDASLIASFSSSYRPPALEELYNFGPHIGTVTFEIGNSDLGHERANGFELSFRQNSNRIRFNGSLFYNRIHNFIFLSPQDDDNDGRVDVEDGLPIGTYNANDATYYGADATFEVDFNDHIGMFFAGDFVKAELLGLGFSPPRITPARIRTGLELKYNGLSFRPEAVFVGRRGASDIFPLETSTAGHGVINFNGAYAFVAGKTTHIFTFGGQNLTDRLYRNHTNFLKDIAPERGRGFKFSYSIRFI